MLAQTAVVNGFIGTLRSTGARQRRLSGREGGRFWSSALLIIAVSPRAPACRRSCSRWRLQGRRVRDARTRVPLHHLRWSSRVIPLVVAGQSGASSGQRGTMGRAAESPPPSLAYEGRGGYVKKMIASKLPARVPSSWEDWADPSTLRQKISSDRSYPRVHRASRSRPRAPFYRRARVRDRQCARASITSFITRMPDAVTLRPVLLASRATTSSQRPLCVDPEVWELAYFFALEFSLPLRP
jgi:hypothetical protein